MPGVSILAYNNSLLDWSWVTSHTDEIKTALYQHVRLVAEPMLFGMLIAFPLAILATRKRGSLGPVLGLTGILYTIPSLAAFAFLQPYFGLSYTTVLIPLTAYTLLILIRMISPPELAPAALEGTEFPISLQLPIFVALVAALGTDFDLGLSVFIEGEEENGSRSFKNFLVNHHDQLAADAIVVADSDNWNTTTPALTIALRGNVKFHLKVSTLDHASHSGMFGGAAPDSMLATITLLATMWDENGSVAVDFGGVPYLCTMPSVRFKRLPRSFASSAL